jgi:hypothetical protein
MPTDNSPLKPITTAPSRIEIAVNGVIELPIEAVVRELVTRVGTRLTVLVGGAFETWHIRDWIAGNTPCRENALRTALQVARAVSLRYDDQSARAWFHSTNAGLGKRAPIIALREAQETHDFERILRCAVQDIS